jgi:hypothetical protein
LAKPELRLNRDNPRKLRTKIKFYFSLKPLGLFGYEFKTKINKNPP